MKRKLSIPLFALVMLLAFSVNIFAFCPCSHDCSTKAKKEQGIKSCCKAKKTKSCTQKDCGCEKNIVKFQMLEKRVSQNYIAIQAALIELPQIFPVKTCAGNMLMHTHSAYKEVLCSVSPPDYCILYRQFRI